MTPMVKQHVALWKRPPQANWHDTAQGSSSKGGMGSFLDTIFTAPGIDGYLCTMCVEPMEEAEEVLEAPAGVIKCAICHVCRHGSTSTVLCGNTSRNGTTTLTWTWMTRHSLRHCTTRATFLRASVGTVMPTSCGATR